MMATAIEPSLEIKKEASEETTSTSKKRSKPQSKGHELQSRTIKTPPWTYIHLNLITSGPMSASQQPLDLLTSRAYLTNALTQFLGVSGSAISVDFLKLEEGDEKAGNLGRVWMRVPREDAGVVLAAVGGWSNGNGIGWKIKSWGNWLGAVHGGSTTGSVWED